MIEISHLTKMYGGQPAVNDISFNVKRGEIVGFLGPNGAGKTTTMKIITCFMPPTSGNVTINNMPVQQNSMEVRRMIGYLPEQNPLYQDINVVDFLRYIAELRNIPKDKQTSRIGRVVDICGLGGNLHKNIGELSKGYRQRVGLAQAMIHDPEILILDEPTIGLDPNQIVEIRNLIKRLGEEKTVILSTHIMHEVESTCDRVIIINEGVIAADRPLSELQTLMAGKEIIHLELLADDGNLMERLEKIEGVETVQELFSDQIRSKDSGRKQGRRFRLTADLDIDPRENIFRAVVEANCVMIEMSKEIRSLEEVFQQLTRSESTPAREQVN